MVIREENWGQKSSLPFYLTLFSVFLIGAGLIFVVNPYLTENQQEKIEKTQEPILQEVEEKYESKPPTLALTGELKVIKDTLEKFSRDKEDWEEIASSSSVLQEERVKTGKMGKGVVTFDNQVKVTLGNESEIYFANLIPSSFLVEQSRGEATYTIEKPISIKSIDTLIYFGSGEITLEINPDNNSIYLNVASGSGKFLFIDNDNQTQVYEIKKGDKVIYNPETTSITIR